MPPNAQTRVAPPKWANYQAYLTAGTYTFIVPANVYQVFGLVIGGGGNGATGGGGGAGGNAGWGIIDV
ncbi:MAG: hypothetical protein EBV05_00720, partial [Cyanobacteria bacterium WB6_1B_304]|nr:hypothetical protein [Cyanobacteria bacterium WB6_1B_304]